MGNPRRCFGHVCGAGGHSGARAPRCRRRAVLRADEGLCVDRDRIDLFGRDKCPKGARVVAGGHGGTGGRLGAPQRALRARAHASGVLMDVLVVEEELGAEMELA